MNEEFKILMGEEALKKLNELLKRECNLLTCGNEIEYEVRKKAVILLLNWIGSVYELTVKKDEVEPDVDFNKLFKVKNN